MNNPRNSVFIKGELIKGKLGLFILLTAIVSNVVLNSIIVGMDHEKITQTYINTVAIINITVIMPMLILSTSMVSGK